MKSLITILMLLLSNVSIAKEYIQLCEPVKNAGWDKIQEKDFSKESIIKKLDEYKAAYEKDYIFADEGMETMLIFIKGSALRQSVEYWKKEGNDAQVKNWRNKFCEFYESAYLPH